jgi:hypothetical protein
MSGIEDKIEEIKDSSKRKETGMSTNFKNPGTQSTYQT